MSKHLHECDESEAMEVKERHKVKPQWFGAGVTAATGGAAELPPAPFPPSLQAVVEP